MKCYLSEKLKLIIKKNYQIFKIEDRGIDFLGYVIRHKYVLLRKGIKNRLFKKIYKIKNTNIIKSISSYNGWLKYCNSFNLKNKVIKIMNIRFSDYKVEIIDCQKIFNINKYYASI